VKHLLVAVLLIGSAFASTGCSRMMGDLRRDFDDDVYATSSEPPVTGGRWAERGFLEESTPGGGYRADRYAAVGHAERRPASAGTDYSGSSERSWITPERAQANRRETYRSPASLEGAAAASGQFVVNEPSRPRTYYKNGERATRSDFVDDSQTEGSLWASNGQTNYYFSKNRVRGVGDIVSIIVEDDLLKDVVQEMKRSLNPAEKQAELSIAQERLTAKFLMASAEKSRADSIQAVAAAPERKPAAEQTQGVVPLEEPVLPTATMADVDIAGAVELKATDTMLAEIMERYPNGNFRIRGTKRVRYRNGSPRLLTLVGIVRAQDITEEDILNSGKLYEYRLEAIQ